ncbi:MAG: hypothetical protein KIT02_00145 [Devosia sp.]|uniref:hypothetical protein n=1 Tax=Devosia sp. TaxID=1871048 RepID=UPI0024C518E6|nr:hypothetical protein [Devosia sp.]UYN99695.1 MAG: hypothetical protein KIT02_00145 [Devosia sp.]
MSSRAWDLSSVTVGDFIFGLRENGRPDFLFVYSADDTTLLARNIFNQANFRFGRDGDGKRIEDDQACTIVSTAELPPEQRQVAIGLDRRMGSNPEYPDSRLTEDEIRLGLDHEDYFEARLLPGKEEIVRRAQRLRAVSLILLVELEGIDERENPASLSEYDDHIPALIELLGKPGSREEVGQALSEIAALRGRPPRVFERTSSVAESLVRLAQSWT